MANRSLLWLACEIAKDAQPEKWKIPEIRILIRDFQLLLDGKTPDDYLSEHLESGEGNNRLINARFWKRRRCNVLPVPHLEPAKLGTIEGTELIKPTEKFINKACTILNDIIQNESSNDMDSSGMSNKIF